MIFLFTFSFPLFTFSQDTVKGDDSEIQQKLENMAENSTDEEADYSSLLEGLIYFKEHPINLNKTNREELQSLQLLTDIQINNLLTHIEKDGKLITIYELQGINGFDLQTIQRLLPYVKVSDNFTSAHFTLKEMFSNGQHAVVIRYGRVLEDQTGFAPIDSAALFKSQNSRYIGSPDKVYARYRFIYGTNISWGITAEKDQGELFFKNKQKFNYSWYENSLNGNQKTGFDFYSAHFFLKNVKFVRSLAIGDYQATFGQGLTIWSGQAFGKSPDIMSVKKSAGGIRPYASVDENRFMRGAATTLGYKQFEATAFYSRKRVDANVSDTTDTGEALAISSLQETMGGNVAYKGKQFNVGVSAMSYQLDVDYKRALSYYNQFEFSSSKNFNVGADYNFIVRNFNFFGEASMSKNGGKAFVNGVLISMDPRLSLTILHRYYQRDFQNLLSNGFAESSSTANEKGLYAGLVAKPNISTTITAYYDRFEFPWLKYQVNAPSYGNDYMAQFNYTPSKKVDMYVRIRTRDKQKNTSTVDVMDYLVTVKQSNYRFNISYTITPSVKLKNRIELIDYKLDNNKTQKGYLVYQDITYSKMGKPFSFTLRYALFESDSYDARIYAYENDVPGSYSIPAYYDRGSRFYILLDYNLTRRIELWLRYSQTYYDNKKVISAGALTEIQGNTKSEIKAQVKFKF
ncbi:MAG: helix-hairpin-helix domain-containing protein [Bacteroidetes bacterium]|nr:helix-hairpin-helix domain-containing protein [Bacteroidota bacterium]